MMTLPARCHKGGDDDFVLHQFLLAGVVHRSTVSVDVGTWLSRNSKANKHAQVTQDSLYMLHKRSYSGVNSSLVQS